MKKMLLVCSTLMLTACVSVPVERKFPTAPTEIMTPCPQLNTLDASTTKLSTVVQSVVTNYGQYQECSVKVDSWIEWYNKQREIFESVK